MEEKRRADGEEIAGKILAALLVVAGAYALFQLVVRGIFSAMTAGNPDNGIYVLFYGGIVVLAVIALMGAGSGYWLWRRARSKSAAGVQPSVFGRGLTIGLVAVLVTAVYLIGNFLRGFR